MEKSERRPKKTKVKVKLIMEADDPGSNTAVIPFSIWVPFVSQTSAVAGIHLQVFGDESSSDRVHRSSVS